MRTFTKWTTIALPLLGLTAAFVLTWTGPPTYMPEKVWGIWKTDHPRYTDRYLDISEAVFAIGQGRQRLQVFFFERVHRAPVGSGERFTLHYHPDGERRSPLQTFSFDFLTTAKGPCIQLTNQKKIFWYREEAPQPSEAAGGEVTP